ncbi:MAG: hypothetical protein D6760_07370 [Deltaproteobacteria bacterium]|nr:MAG: hypothetical protein D6760_07370 [Deltaproteobacteria bacterium]
MLDFMRRNARSWVISVALGVISLVFIFYMGGGARIGAGPQAVAKVDDTMITLTELERARVRNERRYREQMGGNLTAEMLRALDLPSMTLNQMIDRTVLVHEAERIGLRVPDDTLRAAIQRVEAFQRNGAFSPGLYRVLIRQEGLTPAGFEQSMREDILVQQLLDPIRRGVHVTEEQAFEQYRRDNDKITLAYIEVPSSQFRDQVEIDEEGLTKFFEENAEQYRRPEQIRIRYVAYSPEALEGEAQVTDEDIEEYYYLNAETEFATSERVGARHILKKVAPDADEEARKAARAAIEAAAKRIADGEDFAAVAREVSDDSTAAEGGDLGMFERGKMVRPFEEAAFALEEGQVSDIVETPFGFHIIQVYKHEPGGQRPLEEVRDQIAAKLAKEKAAEAAFDLAAADAAEIADGKATLEAVADQRGLKIETTPLLGKGDVVPGIGTAPTLIETALALGEGETSDPIHIGKSYYLVQVAERKPSYVPELAEVREQVEKAYRRQLAAERARERAEELLEKLRGGADIETAAAEAGLEAKQTDPFDRRGSYVPGLGNLRGLKEAAFQTKADGEVLPRVFMHEGDAYVCVRSGYEEADRANFEEVKDTYMERLKQQLEQQAVDAFVAELKQRADISFNKTLVEQFLR